MPGLTLRELAVQHLGHVLVLGGVIYVLRWAVFYFVLLRPLNRIYLHLYTVGAGQLKALELDSNVREIRTIVDGVNLMLSRLKLGGDSDALELAQARIAEIRETTRQLATTDQEHVSVVLDKLADLQRSLPNILVRRGMPPPTPAGTVKTCCSNGNCLDAASDKSGDEKRLNLKRTTRIPTLNQ
jgi:nitrate/nitrite-specific signal transduction histidine kinase